jgi:hypothetical protein
LCPRRKAFGRGSGNYACKEIGVQEFKEFKEKDLGARSQEAFGMIIARK